MRLRARLVRGTRHREVFATLRESTDPFDVWFRQQVKEINGVDMEAPPTDAPPEVLVDWRA